MICTMDNYLNVVTPHLQSELVSPEALSHIRSLTKLLPPSSFAIFESRLGVEQTRVDFSVNFPCINPNFPEILLNHPAWRVFRAICQDWTKPKSFLYDKFTEHWLEFDVYGLFSEVPVPCIFLNLNQKTASKPKELIELVSMLLNYPLSSQFESNMQLSINSLPAKTCINYLGVMQSRSDQTVRLVTNEIIPYKLLYYLLQIGWKGSINILQSLISDLSNFVDYICLSFDIGETVLPRIGLECYLRKQPKYEPRWQLFLDYLVETEMCTPAKRNALLSWPGFSQKALQPDIWPNNLNWGDIFLSSRVLSIFTREISTIKIVYQPGSVLEAKAYLGFRHNWIDTSLLKNK